ncbi:DNA-binding response regulator [Corallococcus sp. H22C18031201]|nr:DNA-binding response regulator [Corallococcus sp. H22C18031201]
MRASGFLWTWRAHCLHGRESLVSSRPILVVEDDAQLGAQVVEHLHRAGFQTEWWREGRRWPVGEPAPWELVILDLMLPGTYGLDLLKDLRAGSDVPVLILSARADAGDRVRALRLGADDYLTKPFWPDELIERVRARLRRPVLQREGEQVRVGPVKLDPVARTVEVDDVPVELTRVEFELLAALARRAGSAVSRRWLVEHALDPEREGTERTLDVHVSRLRKKLGHERLIETVWGIGYRIAVPGSDA